MKFTSSFAVASLLALQATTTTASTCNIAGRMALGDGYILLHPRYQRSDGSSVTDCTLRENNSGPAVKTLQIAYNKCYTNKDTPKIKEDGKFGPKTKAALKDMQHYEGGLGVDGIYGPKTRKKVRFFTKNDENRQFCVRMDPPWPIPV